MTSKVDAVFSHNESPIYAVIVTKTKALKLGWFCLGLTGNYKMIYLGVLNTAGRRLRTGVGYLGSCQREDWQSEAALIFVKFEGGLELV